MYQKKRLIGKGKRPGMKPTIVLFFPTSKKIYNKCARELLAVCIIFRDLFVREINIPLKKKV
jgi:hypothetical protein